MEVTPQIPVVRQAVNLARQQQQMIGCVPTMGALHAGHMSLVAESRRRCGFTCVTIFVNPTQFAPTEDLAKYPRPLEKDLALCREAGVDLVYVPEVPSLYPPGYQTWVTVDEITQPLEGQFRSTHFRGVTTIVAKLFNIVQPDVACFGKKDYQQLATIRRMVRDLDMPIDIIPCETTREPDGLALSSRNIYLSASERQSALSLSQALHRAKRRLQSGESDIASIQREMVVHLESHPEVQVQYAVIADRDSLQELQRPQSEMVALIAAKVGATRLIDNLEISLNTPS
jgi:pantoate--beta-alanine ligase